MAGDRQPMPRITAPNHECMFYGRHAWRLIYRGRTIDVYACSCGARKTSEGSVPRGR